MNHKQIWYEQFVFEAFLDESSHHIIPENSSEILQQISNYQNVITAKYLKK